MNRMIYHILSGRFGAELELRILMRQTAEAFGLDAPKTEGLASPELLRCYARFTAKAAGNALRSGADLKQLHRKLYHMAYRLGNSLRRWMRPRSERECLAIVTLLYRNIGITIDEGQPGEIRVTRCYFSAFYTPDVCAVISAIDKGIFAGVYHGGRLKFRQRITEGYNMCRADLL